MLSLTDAQGFCAKNDITYTSYTHPAFFTTQDSKHYDHIIPGVHTKNLFLMGKKDGNRHTMLVCLSSHKRLSIKTFGRMLGYKDVSFGSPDMLTSILGLSPGSVCIFGCIQTPLPVYMHTDLFTADLVGWHPCINTQTWTFDVPNRRKLYQALKVTPLPFGDELCINEASA
ncbi:MAG: hypothetical protein NZL83_03350 [Candidatus Absconditabacterales bacterium]|nr:hypothetical protein [Candidatus Absconditabacterales bacterium]